MTMRTNLILIALVLLAGGGLAFYHLHQPGHSHGPGGELQLDNRQKWETDQPLRLGMERIRELVSVTKPTFDMQAFANGIREQVDYMATNCRLPPAADETLHAMIADFVEGADLVTKENDPERGIAVMRRALETYPKYFNHPGWRSLGGT